MIDAAVDDGNDDCIAQLQRAQQHLHTGLQHARTQMKGRRAARLCSRWLFSGERTLNWVTAWGGLGWGGGAG